MLRLVPILSVLALSACAREEPPAAARPAPPAARGSARAEPDWGEPDMEKLRRLFKARSGEIRSCYEAALQRDPTTSGRLTLRFTIARGGAIEDVSFDGSTFRRSEVPRCITGLVRGWKTPFRPSEPIAVEYPLRFTPL